MCLLVLLYAAQAIKPSSAFASTPRILRTVAADSAITFINAPSSADQENPARSDESTKKPAFSRRLQDLREAATTKMQEAEQLRIGHDENSLRKSLEKYEDARANLRTIGDKESEIKTLLGAAEVLQLLDDHKRALSYYRTGLNLSRRIRNDSQTLSALSGIGLCYARLRDNQNALIYFSQALDLSRKTGNRQAEARSLTNLGISHYDLSNMKTALDYLDQAVKLWPTVGEAAGYAEALKYLGYTFSDLSEPGKALTHYRAALEILRATRAQQGEAQITTAIGLAYYLLGERGQAIESYAEAERIFRAIGDRRGLITALNGRGAVYAAIGSERALNCHLEALQLSVEIDDAPGQIVALRYLGNVYRLLGNANRFSGEHQRALEYYNQSIERHQQALKLSRILKDRRIEAYTLQDLGGLYETLGQNQEALGCYHEALVLSRLTDDRRGQAASLNGLGSIFAAQGKSQHALVYFQQSLSLARAAGDRGRESLSLYNLARIERDRNNPAKAKSHIEAAIKINEGLRAKMTSPDYRAAYFASTRNCYEMYISILRQIPATNSDNNFTVAAFQISEQARARTILELMSESNVDIREGVDAALLEREQMLEQTLNTSAERRTRMSASGNTDEVRVVTKEIDQLTTELDEIKARIKSKSPRYAALTQPQPLTLKQIQALVLDDNSLLLEYMLGEERSYLWAVTRTEITSYELPGRARIEAAVASFRNLLIANQPRPGETLAVRQARIAEATARLPEEAAALSQLIIGPVIDKLGTKRLLIVPDGALQYIPFQALPVPATASTGELIPLLVDHEIVYQPSASALALVRAESAQRKPARHSVAVFANPVFEADDPRVKSSAVKSPQTTDSAPNATVKEAFRDVGFGEGIPALPASREEAEAIMAVAPWGTGLKAIGFDASRATVSKPELAHYRIVHFATHGLVDYQHPELSGLVLSLVDQDGKPQDGFLRLHDIYYLKLSANLVVLSACNTGLGKEVRGEGLMGMTRGFMYAGATAVAASLWKVDDEATAELMKGFYEGMFRKGLTPAAALRESQLAMWRQKRWHAPYYWAAFIIQGQYDQSETIASPQMARPEWLVTLTGLLSCLFLASCLLLGRRRSRIL